MITVFDLMRFQMTAALSAVTLHQRLVCAFWPGGPMCQTAPAKAGPETAEPAAARMAKVLNMPANPSAKRKAAFAKAPAVSANSRRSSKQTSAGA